MLIGGAMTLWILVSKEILQADQTVDRLRILCDAFFVPGILLTCFGALIEIANSGFFHVFSYSANLFKDRFTREKKFRKTYHDYFEYVMVKQDEKKAPTAFILHTGLLYIFIAAIFNIGFFCVY